MSDSRQNEIPITDRIAALGLAVLIDLDERNGILDVVEIGRTAISMGLAEIVQEPDGLHIRPVAVLIDLVRTTAQSRNAMQRLMNETPSGSH